MACKFQIFCNFKNSLGHGNIVHCQKIYGTMFDFGCLIQNALRFEGMTGAGWHRRCHFSDTRPSYCHPYEDAQRPNTRGPKGYGLFFDLWMPYTRSLPFVRRHDREGGCLVLLKCKALLQA